MSADQWQDMWALYHGARSLAADEREAFFRRQSHPPALVDEVRRLLQAQPPAGFLEPAENQIRRELVAGDELDGFEIEGVLGEGGMGTVYLARETGSLTRPVAIKVVRRGMDTDRILRRFQAEQGTLARLDHPSIATVHRSGVTGDGRPYFVMQYVQGVPLDEYCDAKNLNLFGLLGLFAAICDVVQYTHQKGVIHRDLKPSNILVSLSDGHVTLIDFGIAKAVNTEETALTREGQALGTPEYMSPEQATGDVENVDTRSDIFALGRVMAEIARDANNTDLGSVVGKATAADRNQRYATAADLARDIRCVLARQPVSARPPGRWYVLRRFVQRHPLGVSAAVVAVTSLAILVGFLVNLTFALRTALERSDAERSRAEQLASFMLDTFASADPYVVGGEPPTARDLLDRGVERIRQSSAPAQVRAELLVTMGNTYRRLGVHDTAEELGREVVALLEGNVDPDAMRILASALRALGSLYEVQSRFEEGIAVNTRAWEIRSGPLGDKGEAASILSSIGFAQLKLGRYAEAEQSLSQARTVLMAEFGSDHQIVANLNSRMGSLFSVQARFAEAVEAYSSALASNRARVGEQHPQVGTSHNNLAALYYRMGRYDDAAVHYQAALAIQQAIHAPDHPSVSIIENNLAALYVRIGQPELALPLALSALAKRRRVLGATNLEVGVTAYHAACAERDLGNYAAADALFAEATAIVENAAGPEDRRLGVLFNGQAESLVRQNRFEAALAVAQRAREINDAGWPPAHRQPGESKLLLARIAIGRGDPATALALADEAKTVFDANTGAPFEQALAVAVLGQAKIMTGAQSEGRALLAEALPVLESSARGASLNLAPYRELLPATPDGEGH